ncbi:MAG: acyl-CoA dehydratase activase [Thermacetogeniaceae bacterium]
MLGVITAGIDVGSLSTDAVLLEDGRVLAYSIVNTGSQAQAAAERAFEEVLEKAGVKRSDVECVVATGYGRMSVPFADAQVTEISCHACGSAFLDPEARTVIDIGGQDSKVIRLGPGGSVVDFLMNDKCAAGTGRFLEVMADRLELSVAALGDEDFRAERAAEISSMCTVFAESEVVSLIAQGVPRCEIVRGLHRSIAERTAGMANRLGVVPKVMMTGGVAKNKGVVRALSEKLGVEIVVPQEPQIVGALGAAMIARKRVAEKRS